MLGGLVFFHHRVKVIKINGKAENAHSKYYIPDKELIELRKNYVGVDRSGRGGIIEWKGKAADSGVFHSMADPMVEVLGAGENSHPQEIKAYQDELKLLGVELIRKDTEMLAYSPALRAGNPGTVYISQGASYSAWSHEMQHVRDDYKDGWTGMKILEHPDTRYAREVKAYEIEIQLAQAAGKPDIVKRLKENLEKERREIYGE